jgi:ABC-2 type transport system permease protein
MESALVHRAAGRPGAVGSGGPGLRLLLGAKLRAASRRLTEGGTIGRALAIGVVGLLFWSLLFTILYRMLRYFRGVEGLGDVLAVKLLGLVLLTLLSILLLSNVITALSSFFLARDLELLVASPLDGLRIYAARLLETMTHSSWMVLLVLVPILTAYGWVYGGSWAFIGVSLLSVGALLALPAVLGSAFTLLLVNVFPARRARDLLALGALFGAAGLILLFRLMRPEQLARPEGFRSLVHFVATLDTPRSPWLPSDWGAQAIMASLRGGDLFPLLLLVATAAAFVVLGAWLHGRLYRAGFSRSQEGAERREQALRTGRRLERALAWLPVSARSLVAKDIRNFFRDTTQWSQLILLAVLVVIYVYNIKALPLWTGEQVSFLLVNVVSFLNLGLSGFVLAAIAARFVFPLISLEGRTLWLLRSSPLHLRSLVWVKFWVGVAPLLVLSLTLTLATNVILEVGPFMMALSLGTTALMTFAICALALGFGALFPRFDSDNAAEVATGFGGLLFMMTSIGYLAAVIVVQAWPVYAVLQARFTGTALEPPQLAALAFGLGLAFAISVVAVVLPLRAAVQRVEYPDR